MLGNEEPLENEDYWAARLALLSLRVTTRGGNSAVVGSYRIDLSPRQLSTHEAAQYLIGQPKPLDCRASVRGKILSLSLRVLSPTEREVDRWVKGGLYERGGPYASIMRRHGSSNRKLTVKCVGDTESLIVAVGALDRFCRDYRESRITTFSVRLLDDVEEGDATKEAAVPVALVTWSPPPRWNVGFVIPQWLLRGLQRVR
jgi:hypothetical protein